MRNGMRITTCLGTAALLLLTAVAPAAAQDPAPTEGTEVATTQQSVATCADPLIVNPFAAYGDSRDYVLAPGGSFEDPKMPGWEIYGNGGLVSTLLSGKTGTTGSDDPFQLNEGTDTRSLKINKGGSVVSPAMCVDLNYPTFRFVSRTDDDDDAKLAIEVIYPDAPNPAFEEVARLDGENNGSVSSGGWRISDDIAVRPDRGGLEPGARRVAFRFRAIGEDWRLDDVFVDPKRH